MAILIYVTCKRQQIASILQRLTESRKQEEDRMMESTNPLARALLTGRTSFSADQRAFSITEVLRGVRMAGNSFINAIKRAKSDEQKPLVHTGMIKFLTLLYRGYSPSYYYWEIIIMLRGVAFVFVACFTRRYETNIKAAALLIFCMIFVPLQLSYYPYSSRGLNHLEASSLLICVVTAMLGIRDEEDATQRNNLILMGMNGFLLVFAIVWSLRNTILNIQYSKAIEKSREILQLQRIKTTRAADEKDKDKDKEKEKEKEKEKPQKTTLEKLIELKAHREVL
jgi:hypothetical protein